MMKSRLITITVLFAVAILNLSCVISMKKVDQPSGDEYRKLKLASEYKVFNEKGEALAAQIFINQKTITGENTKELFVYFKTAPSPFVIVVAIPPQLIGIPELYNTMKLYQNSLYIKKESLRFTPINVGIEKMIEKYSISEALIDFEAFGKLSLLGKRIIIKRI